MDDRALGSDDPRCAATGDPTIHRVSTPVESFLTLVSGIAWTIVYIEAIRVGFRQRTYAIPVAALALNFAWESSYAVYDLTHVVSLQTFVTVAWALADVAIVYTYVRFGRAELPSFITRPMFVGWVLLLFATSYALQWLFIAQFGPHDASRYSAFLQNLLMSGLFIAMLVARRGLRGQTLTIAIAKWLGTLAPTILFGVIEGSPLVLGLGILCSVFDLVYIGLVRWVSGHPDLLPEARPPDASSRPESEEADYYGQDMMIIIS